MKLFSSSIQHVISKLLDLTVQRIAVKIVVDQTMTATTSMAPVFSVAMMDIKEKDARIVSYYYTLHPFPDKCDMNILIKNHATIPPFLTLIFFPLLLILKFQTKTM